MVEWICRNAGIGRRDIPKAILYTLGFLALMWFIAMCASTDC